MKAPHLRSPAFPDGNRVNVIAPPLALDGPTLDHPEVQARTS